MRQRHGLETHPDSLAGMKIGIFGKGGSGKSTILVLLAQALARRGHRVTVLDADSTNQGLSQALDIHELPQSLMDYFGGAVFQGGSVTCPVDDPTPLAGATLRLRDLPPAYRARSPLGIRYLVAGKIGNQGPGAGCDGPVAKIARDLRLPAELTLVDFKAGFEDSARGVVTGIDWGLVVVDPSTASLRIAADMQSLFDALIRHVPPATRHLEAEGAALMRDLFRHADIRGLSFVLNRIDNPETEAYLRSALEEESIEALASVPADPAVARAWLRGSPLHAAKKDSEVFVRLAQALEELVPGRAQPLAVD